METAKKKYCQPSLKVVMIESADLIATSSPSRVSLQANFDDIEADGYAD